MKRIRITHPAMLYAKHTKRDHERFNHAATLVHDNPRLHHDTLRVTINKRDPSNAEAIALMLANAEGVHA